MPMAYGKWLVQCGVLALMAGAAAFLWWQNHGLCVRELTVRARVREEVRMLHLSDLHGEWFGHGQSRMTAAARALRPDVIVMTGDFIDQRHDERAAAALLRELAKIAPVYCVTGNHEGMEQEAGNLAYERLLTAMEQPGVRLLRGETVELKDGVTLAGADDVSLAGGMEAYPQYIRDLSGTGKGYRILLAHRPELFDMYTAAGFDLTLAGHAHGGQIRLPIVGGLFAPGQGVLPEYTSGLYEQDNGARMVVSRGLGNSDFPVRLLNRPDVTLVVLKPEGGE